LEKRAISDVPQAAKSVQFGKKVARFSIGVNVWQLNKYMIIPTNRTILVFKIMEYMRNNFP